MVSQAASWTEVKLIVPRATRSPSRQQQQELTEFEGKKTRQVSFSRWRLGGEGCMRIEREGGSNWDCIIILVIRFQFERVECLLTAEANVESD